MTQKKYYGEGHILKDKVPVLEPDLIKWAIWIENVKNRRIAYNEIGEKRVSTIFLGLDYNLFNEGPPLFFETVVFPITDLDKDYCRRYSTWDEAMQGHAEICKVLLEGKELS